MITEDDEFERLEREKKMRLDWAPKGPPKKREWIGLTNEEIIELGMEMSGRTTDDFVQAIEAKLKERNG